MYASLADLQTRLAPQTLVELADDNGDGVADGAVIGAVLADASALIDLFIAARYATPIASRPQLLALLAADLAIHALFARHRQAAAGEHAARYAEAIRTLGQVAAGKLSLAGAAPRDLPESTRRGEAKTFSGDSLEEF
jgi:phage gp36-like protein